MNSKQAETSGAANGLVESDKPTKIGIITDPPNAMIEGAFESQLLRAISAENPPPPVTISATPILSGLHTTPGESELRDQLNSDFVVVVAMLGVPSSSYYEKDIHQLLSAWSSAKKPVLLIASNDPRATRKAVDNWQGWEPLAKQMHQPVDVIKQAVIVNDEYLIAQSGKKALAQIRNSINVATSMKDILLQPQPTTPPITVKNPSIDGLCTGVNYTLAV